MKNSLIIKRLFLRLISKNNLSTTRANESPSILILLHQNIGDMIIYSLILREKKYRNYSNKNE